MEEDFTLNSLMVLHARIQQLSQLCQHLTQYFWEELYLSTMRLKESIKKYSPYFVDVWQYIAIIVIFIFALIFFL
jgi:hypothetical protein